MIHLRATDPAPKTVSEQNTSATPSTTQSWGRRFEEFKQFMASDNVQKVVGYASIAFAGLATYAWARDPNPFALKQLADLGFDIVVHGGQAYLNFYASDSEEGKIIVLAGHFFRMSSLVHFLVAGTSSTPKFILLLDLSLNHTGSAIATAAKMDIEAEKKAEKGS